MDTFTTFLESLATPNNEFLIDSICEGYGLLYIDPLFEGFDGFGGLISEIYDLARNYRDNFMQRDKRMPYGGPRAYSDMLSFGGQLLNYKEELEKPELNQSTRDLLKNALTRKLSTIKDFTTDLNGEKLIELALNKIDQLENYNSVPSV